MRNELTKWLRSKVYTFKMYGTGRYVQVCIESGFEISLIEIMQLKEKLGAEDVQVSSVHNADIGYCLMIEFYK